jgi:hypothetical protein
VRGAVEWRLIELHAEVKLVLKMARGLMATVL